MQSVSTAFAPYADVRRVDMSVRFELLDNNAQGAAVPTVSGQEDISQLAQLTDDVIAMGGKFATLEPDSWILGAGHKIMPDSVAGIQTGWWSDVLSGTDGAFASPPSLTFDFGMAITTIGYMLYFDDTADSVPTSIRVTTYDNADAVIDQATLSNSSAACVLEFPSQDYYAVKFEFLSTSVPERRVRLAECVFGIIQYFNGDSIVKADFDYSADLTAEAFPSRQLSFTFDNLDHKYNLINPDGLYAYLQEGQDLIASLSIDGEAIDMGTYEFSSATASDDEVTGTITANDYVLSALNEPTVTGSNTTRTIYDALTLLLAGTGIEFSTADPDYNVVTAYPENTTLREAIRLLAQATMCSVWVDRAGVLQIQPLTVAETEDDELNADRMPSMGGIAVSEPVDSVVLTVRNEYADTEAVYTSGTGKRVKAISNPCVVPANGQAVADWLLAQLNRRVKYDKPYRGNPAVEIGDTLKIYDAYGENRNAAVTSHTLSFDGGLTARIKAVGA